MANSNVIESVNVVKNVAYAVIDGAVDERNYRVTLQNAIKGYRTNDVGERVEVDVISFLIPRNVFLAIACSKLPMLAKLYAKSKAMFDSVPENDGKILDFTQMLNNFLIGGEIKLEQEFHAAGEVQTLADGSTIEHEKDKYNTVIMDVAYGDTGKSVVAELEARERAKALADAMAILGL